ncbi:MAG: hypothetical protein JNM48_12740, partial [Rhodospirillales bacterium]|nr:hypothetical protein [Rhodospirillales bacterium]
MVTTTELDAAALKIMQEELAIRQGDPDLAARDAHGHPTPTRAGTSHPP